MIALDIPGRGRFVLKHLVSDVNGRLALDGRLIEGISGSLLALADRLQLHLLTADTHGRQNEIDRQLSLTAVRIRPGGEAQAEAIQAADLVATDIP